ncbi:hypothetical protein NECAME_14745 [Necator americanus]|uniref:Zeta toxin domain-containing protein n=1 Tax=Necator americanus TaxID=51031 RepID=W2SLB2_NECAM|nr:hypothetical protein NECAME_14745 [Necator americanus]ETN70459.1 hypothetical protein NECAME_14745 [Necator americanus]
MLCNTTEQKSLSQTMEKERMPFIIGVSGGPSSGKTLVIQRIMERFQALNERPTAFDFDKFADTMTQLENGFSVTIPHYDNFTSSR